jgi:hypothetical protein
VEDNSQLWTIRPYTETDRNFIIYAWCASAKSGPDGLVARAPSEKLAAQHYWLFCEKLSQKLVDTCDVTVAEADLDGSKVIVGYLVSEGDDVVHYCLTRRKFQRMGVAKDLLSPFMDREVAYSQRPSTKGLPIPDGWRYDPYQWLKHFK